MITSKSSEIEYLERKARSHELKARIIDDPAIKAEHERRAKTLKMLKNRLSNNGMCRGAGIVSKETPEDLLV